MIHITQTQLAIHPQALSQLAREFSETGIALMPGFLTPPILAPLLRLLERTAFVPKHEMHEGTVFGTTDFVPVTEPLIGTLQFLLNRSELFQAVERITGAPALGNFMGRLHRTGPSGSQAIDWHNDATDFRTVGLNMNLGAQEFSGGLFQIRGPDGRMRAEIKHQHAGDAFLFRIERGWQHRLTPVESGLRTVAVGWFRTQPKWQISTRAWRERSYPSPSLLSHREESA
jgi:hypothetical protein